MPFAFGALNGPDVVLLDGGEVTVELGDVRAAYVLFVHVAEDTVTAYQEGLADDQVTGWDLGELVSEYVLEHDDGSVTRASILRRFAIKQARYEWGGAPAVCVPAADDVVFPSADELQLLGRPVVEPGELAGAAERGFLAARACGTGVRAATADAGRIGGRDGRHGHRPARRRRALGLCASEPGRTSRCGGSRAGRGRSVQRCTR